MCLVLTKNKINDVYLTQNLKVLVGYALPVVLEQLRLGFIGHLSYTGHEVLYKENNFKLKRNGGILRLALKRENDSWAQREEVGCIQIKQYKLKSNVLSSGVGREHYQGPNCRSRVRRQRKSVEIRSDRGSFFLHL